MIDYTQEIQQLLEGMKENDLRKTYSFLKGLLGAAGDKNASEKKEKTR